MRLKEIYEKHLALLEGGVGLFFTLALIIPLAVYNSSNDKNKTYNTYTPLINDDSVNINIDLNNFLFSSFNDSYLVFRYKYDREKKTFIKDDSFKINSYRYFKNEKFINCELINNGYDENKDFFINNALNNYAYISCLKEDEPYLVSSLSTLEESIETNYLFNLEKNYEEVFNKENKKIVFYYDKDDLLNKFELLNYLSLYAKRSNSLALINIKNYEDKLLEDFKNINLDYLKSEKVVLVDYEGSRIQGINSAEEGSLILKDILEKEV